MKMVNGGVTIEVVNAGDIPHYLKAGFVRAVEQPVERRAAVKPVEMVAQTPVEMIEPEEEGTDRPVKKAKARKKETNGNS